MEKKTKEGFKVRGFGLSEKIKDEIANIKFHHQNKDQNDEAALGGALKHLNFPLRQLYRPSIPYPLWNYRWNKQGHKSREHICTRHIILIRHGQYEEHHHSDSLNILTELGRKQAKLCGKRLAAMIKHNNEKSGKSSRRIMVTSNLSRAKETGAIIESQLQQELDEHLKITEHDPLLNEGHAAHHIPCEPLTEHTIEKWDLAHATAEKAFEKYFIHPLKPNMATGDTSDMKSVDTACPGEEDDVQCHQSEGHERHIMPLSSKPHEFEILVTHSNLIRYLTCRALQLPPETWLRFSLYNTSITYLVVTSTGTVTSRMIGDVGHLEFEDITLSQKHGFDWNH